MPTDARASPSRFRAREILGTHTRPAPTIRRVIYQHPLAYLLGLEGIALLRAYAGEHDRPFTEARLAEVRDLLDRADLRDGAVASPRSTDDGYRAWADSYDSPGNQLIDIEQPVVRGLVDRLPSGVALDAACGTGRHSAYLSGLGHRVIGVDRSPEMLAVARVRVPRGTFLEGDLERLPLSDDSIDLVVCALALTHVPDLPAAFAELTRVLRPGGHLVTSDSRGILDEVAVPMVSAGPDGQPVFMPNHAHRTSDYLKAALSRGLRVRACEEPRRPWPLVGPDGTPTYDVDPLPPYDPAEPGDIWSLHRFAVDATNAVYRHTPAALVWHFQLDAG
jgi:SAM-dependent methyltransferase